MAGARDRDDGLIADHDRLERGATADTGLIAKPDDCRNRSHAGMHRTLPIAVIKLDAVPGSAGNIGGVEQIGAAMAPGDGNAASGANLGQHGFGTTGEIAARSGNDHAERVEKVPLGGVLDVWVKRIPFEVLHQCYDRFGAAVRRGLRCGGVQCYPASVISSTVPAVHLRHALIEATIEDTLGDPVFHHLDRAAGDHPSAGPAHAIFGQGFSAIAEATHDLYGVVRDVETCLSYRQSAM